jgi:serine/threonine protein kinase
VNYYNLVFCVISTVHTLFPEAWVKFYASELILALGYLHSKGILYRDLKPENILLSEEGHAILTDFGLCKEGVVDGAGIDSNQRILAKSFVGTPEYLAPEIITGALYGKACDWYSLGVTLFELATGQPPYYHTDKMKLYKRVLESEPNFPAQMSRPLRDLLSKLLCKNPKHRLGSKTGAQELQNHPFFCDVNWNDAFLKRIRPPFSPVQQGKFTIVQTYMLLSISQS